MTISNRLLATLERHYHQGFKIHQDTPSRSVQLIQSILQVRPKAYYQKQDNVATATEWPELDHWKDCTQKFQIHLTPIKHYKMMYGEHKNHKFADLFTLQYTQTPNPMVIQTQFQKVLNTYYRQAVQQCKINVFTDDENQQLLMIII